MRSTWQNLITNWYARSVTRTTETVQKTVPEIIGGGVRRLIQRPGSQRQRKSRSDLFQGEALEGRTLLAAPVINGGQGSVNFSILENPANNPNWQAAFDAQTQAPLTTLTFFDQDGHGVRQWDITAGNVNNDNDNDGARAFRLVRNGQNVEIWINDDSDGEGNTLFGNSPDSGGEFNYELNSQFNLTVRVIDTNGEQDTIGVNINVIDLNDRPYIPVDFVASRGNNGETARLESNVFYVPENSQQGTFVGDLHVEDGDNDTNGDERNDENDDVIRDYRINNPLQIFNGIEMVDVFVINDTTGRITINPNLHPNSQIAQQIVENYFDYENPGAQTDHFTDTPLPGPIPETAFDLIQNDWYAPIEVQVTDFRNSFDGLDMTKLDSFNTTVWVGLEDVSEFAPVVPELELFIDENTDNNNIAGSLVGVIKPDHILADDSDPDGPNPNAPFIPIEVFDGAATPFDPSFDNDANADTDVAMQLQDTPSLQRDRGQEKGTGEYRFEDYTYNLSPASNPGGAFSIVPIVDQITGETNSFEVRVNNPSAIDFEQRRTFTLEVEITDTSIGQLSTDTTITINLNDLNEPTTVNNSTFTLDENSPVGTFVGTVDATDEDIFTADLLYEIVDGNEAVILVTNNNIGEISSLISPPVPLHPGDTVTFQGMFEIDPDTGVIRVASNISDDYLVNQIPYNEDLSAVDPVFFLNYEETPSYGLSVRVTDRGNQETSDEGTVTINLIDVSENPPMIENQEFTIAENRPDNFLVGTVVATPGVDSSAPLQYQIDAGNINGAFRIDPNNGQLFVDDPTEIDFESRDQYVMTVRVTDSSMTALFDIATVTVNVTDLSEPVNINPGQIFNIDENSDAGTEVVDSTSGTIGPVQITDSDEGQTYQFELLGGNFGNTFAIDNNGQITVNSNDELDFETNPQFVLTVRVTDSGNPSFADTELVTINVNNVEPEPPTISDDTVTINEYSANGSLVYDVDPSLSQGQTASFAIIGGNTGGAFMIDSETGEITVADENILDFDDNPTFNLVVEAVDADNPLLTDTATITVNLNNLDFAPIMEDQTLQVEIGAADGSSVGFIQVTERDAENVLTFTVLSDSTPADIFTVDPNTGEVTVEDMSLVTESNSPATIFLQVQDNTASGALSDTATITIEMLPPNTAPSLDDVVFEIEEHSPIGTSVGTLMATDAESATQTLTYSILSGNELGGFNLDPTTGELTVADDTVIDFSRNPTFTLDVQVQDDGRGSLTDTATVTVNLTKFNSPIEMSPQDQYRLELLNRLRFNPGVEAVRLGLPQNLVDELSQIPVGSLQPLAPNQFLNNAALMHTMSMFDNDFFGHIDPTTGDNFDDRAFDAGYESSILAENLEQVNQAAGDQMPLIDQLHRRILLDPVSRANVLDPRFEEVGIGIQDGVFTNAQNQDLDLKFISELLGLDDSELGPNPADPTYFVTGVVFADTMGDDPLNDDFYSIGEQISTGTIRVVNTDTNEIFERDLSTSGGFSLEVPEGTYDVSYIPTVNPAQNTVTVNDVEISDKNVKIDFNINPYSVAGTWKTSMVGVANGNLWVAEKVDGVWTTTLWGNVGNDPVLEFFEGDFNGDGVQDVAAWMNNGDWQVGLSNGTNGFAVSNWGNWQTTNIKEVQIGDFNGDGSDDIVGLVLNNDGVKGDWNVGLSNGSSFNTSTFTTFARFNGIADSLVGDFDNDGRDDLAVMTVVGSWWNAMSTGNSFVSDFWTKWDITDGVDFLRAADFNGDGVDDIAGLMGSSLYRDWQVGVSDGSSYTNSVWTEWRINTTLDQVLVGDFNNDGAADLAGLFNMRNLWVGTSTGTSFIDTFWDQWTHGPRGFFHVGVADVNADGNDDIVALSRNGYWYVSESNASSFNTTREERWTPNRDWKARVGDFAQNAPAPAPFTAFNVFGEEEEELFGDSKLLDYLYNA